MSTIFRYQDGAEILANDIILFTGLSGVVNQILQPQTLAAKDYACFDSGGVLLDVPDGLGFVLIQETHLCEDLLLSRRNG